MRHSPIRSSVHAAVLSLTTAMLAACGEKPAPVPVQQQPSVIEPQMRALERAKGVEQTIQNSADNQRRAIDEAGR